MRIDNSLKNASWVLSDVDRSEAVRIAQGYGLPEIVARLLVLRGVSFDNVEHFLNPKLSTHFPDPFNLKDMKAAADFTAQSFIEGKKIGVFADFDVDGATSSAVMRRFFRHLGQEIPVYIPDRLSEGYGPSAEAYQSLKDQGADLVITVDCGITSFDPIKAGKDIGLDLIILDHHEPEDTLPVADFVIDPKRRDDSSGYDELAACGVAFLFCVAVNNRLREKGYFEQSGKSEPPLKDWLDIVALGTVCDMVPQRGPNRLLLREGFKRMEKLENPGIAALYDVANVSGVPNGFTCGFQFGPRINAGSRVHKSDLGSALLSTDDYAEAKNIAWTLDDCNTKRKDIEKQMLAEAVEQVKETGQESNNIIIVGNEGWHSGLSGLVAGRIKERFGRPACLISYAKNEKGELEGRGSGRSVPGVNMAAAFIDARNEGHIIKGGGHAMAGGFTLRPDQVEDFTAYLNDHIEKQLNGAPIVPIQDVDAVVTVRGANLEFVSIIHEQMAPFGQGNPEPKFMLSNVRIAKADLVGKNHLRCYVSDIEGGGSLVAMAFRSSETEIGQALKGALDGTPLNLLGTFNINEWQGRRSVQFFIDDVAHVMQEVSTLEAAE